MPGTIVAQGAARPTRDVLWKPGRGSSGAQCGEQDSSRSQPYLKYFQSSPSLVHDGSQDRFEIEASAGLERVHFTCFVANPTALGHVTQRNEALAQWLHTDVSWRGNMVVVAHVGGVVLDFTPDLTELYRAGFTRLIGTRPMRTAITSTQEPEAIRRCRHALQSRLEMRADTQAPRMCQAEELLLGILRLVDFAGLAHTSRSCRQFRRLVKVVIKDRVAKTLTPYFPPSALGSFFYKLRLARGLIFGDVPLQIILDRCWTCTDLDVSVAYEDHADMIGWLGANGYPDSTESDQRFPGCKTYNMPHQTKEDVRVLLSVSYDSRTWRPALSCRTSVGPTVLTSAGLYSCFTELAERGLVVASDMSTRDQFIDRGFGFSLNAQGRSEPCGLMCPRKMRRLDVPEGIDKLNWGGMDGTWDPCPCELHESTAPLQWCISAQGQCRNGHCGNQASF